MCCFSCPYILYDSTNCSNSREYGLISIRKCYKQINEKTKQYSYSLIKQMTHILDEVTSVMSILFSEPGLVLPETKTRHYNERLTLQCHIPHIHRWTFNNQKLPADVTFSRNRLRIKHMQRWHEGFYICEGYNYMQKKVIGLGRVFFGNEKLNGIRKV